MATSILNLNAAKIAALKLAFGWESYPNGNSGFPEKAVIFLGEIGVIAKYKRGNAHVTGTAVAKSYWTKKQIRALKEHAAEKWVNKKQYFEANWPKGL